MNQDQHELSFDESVKQIMDTLPPAIHTYLVQKKYTPIARNLMAKYGLRIDQGGILERGMMLLLMGIEDPAEFSKALVEEAKLDQQTVNSIMQDVNTEIFMPLRDEMRKETPTAPEAAKPAAATPPRALLARAKLPQVLIPVPPSQKPALRDVLASVMKAPPAPQKPAPPPPPNLPGAMPEKPSPITPSSASPTQPTPPKPIVPITSYSTDPYREPIDEK